MIIFTYTIGRRGGPFRIVGVNLSGCLSVVCKLPRTRKPLCHFNYPFRSPATPPSFRPPEESPAPVAPHNDLSRRSLLLAGPTLLGATAISYARVVGANERIRLGHVGIGNRGRELASVVAGLKSTQNVEMIAVCDLWNVNRERAAKAAADEYGRPPRSFQYVEDLLADKDVDAVIISTADFQHAPLLRLAAEAGKDAYCEKPMAN